MRTTQNQRVLRHLEDFGSISPIDALKEYGIMRLASRISDLKKEGYPITRRIVPHTNRYGEPTHYAVYSLEGKNNGRMDKVTQENS